jgi:hypothetical protein
LGPQFFFQLTSPFFPFDSGRWDNFHGVGICGPAITRGILVLLRPLTLAISLFPFFGHEFWHFLDCFSRQILLNFLGRRSERGPESSDWLDTLEPKMAGRLVIFKVKTSGRS